MKRAIGTIASLGAVVALLAGCGGSAGSTDKAAANGTRASSECPNGGTVRFAVEPYESTAVLLPIYKQLSSELQNELGCKVELQITTNYTSEVEAMRAGKLDVGQFGPFGYTLAHKYAGAQSLVAWPDAQGKPASYYASIVTPADSGITNLQGVRGKSFAYSDPASTSGHLIPAFLLKQAGIDPKSGIHGVYAGSHTASYEALRNGKVAAGELNSQEIAAAKVAGDYDPSAFRTLAKSKQLPLDPIAVRGNLPAQFKTRLKQALMRIDLTKLSSKARQVVGADGPHLVPQPDSAYNYIRTVQHTLGLGLQDLG